MKLADLLELCPEDTQSAAWYLQFALALHIDVEQAKSLYRQNGDGYIYAPTGFVMPDTPRLRGTMAQRFDAVVVVESSGRTWIKTRASIGRMRRGEDRLKRKQEERRLKAEKAQYREDRDREKMFHSMLGQKRTKHGGKADSLGCIGKYVERASARCADQKEIRLPYSYTMK